MAAKKNTVDAKLKESLINSVEWSATPSLEKTICHAQTLVEGIEENLHELISINEINMLEASVYGIFKKENIEMQDYARYASGILEENCINLDIAINEMRRTDLYDFQGMTNGHVMIQYLLARDPQYGHFGLSRAEYICRMIALDIATDIEHLGFMLQQGELDLYGLKILYACGEKITKIKFYKEIQSDDTLKILQSMGSSINRKLGHKPENDKYQEAIEYACSLWDKEKAVALHNAMAVMICENKKFKDLRVDLLMRRLKSEAQKRNKLFGMKGIIKEKQVENKEVKKTKPTKPKPKK